MENAAAVNQSSRYADPARVLSQVDAWKSEAAKVLKTVDTSLSLRKHELHKPFATHLHAKDARDPCIVMID